MVAKRFSDSVLGLLLILVLTVEGNASRFVNPFATRSTEVHYVPSTTPARFARPALVQFIAAKRAVEGDELSSQSADQSFPQFNGPGYVPSDTSAQSPGDILGDGYKVLGLMGRGSSGVTYKAEGPDGTVVAVKTLSLRAMSDWKQLQLFEREANALKGLNHPGIPRYIDYFEEDTDTDRRFYIVQELAEGKTLSQLVQEGWRVDETEARRIARELLLVLQYLGSLRPPVVHRDVKPDNIVMEGGRAGGRVFLVDFGGVQAASVAAGSLTPMSTIVGTYGYMAPEQFRGAAQPQSDLYSLGATLLYLVSGRQPSEFRQDRLRIDFSGLISVSEEWEDLLEGLLEPLPEDRLTADQAMRLLEGQPRRLRTGSMGGKVGGRQPAGSKAVVKKRGANLVVEIPPAGITGDTVMTGSFALIWNLFVFSFTASALAAGGLLPVLFMIPFWAAGAQIAKVAVGSSFTRERLVIGRRRFSLSRQFALFKDGQASFDDGEDGQRGAVVVEGLSRDLREARIVTTMEVNGVPQTAISLSEGVRKHVFGEGLDTFEQEWLVRQINDAIDEAADRPDAGVLASDIERRTRELR
ncbi:unnamed protein product [Ostreobium quekettii]|uniref:non-specific serine/threonine protein kinase n=1 Tax=Ostreobium quekettii TaxID=121088 RepID=A0A8S1ITC7_9CHLO|nr:unnamed protein product [Ostreobium quekettii]